MKLELLISVGFLHCTPVLGYHFSVVTSKTMARSSSLFAMTQASTVGSVSTVSVCTAELCCCQEDGTGGLEILDNLKARTLPYRIDEVPCLGACGGGAMVAIDFDDGTSALVTGLQETLMELGLTPTPNNPILVDNETEESKTTEERIFFIDDNTKGKEVFSQHIRIEAKAPVKHSTVEKYDGKENSSNDVLVDVRERMRAQSLKEEERVNPWLKAATYLANKAAEKVFGEK